MPEGAPNAAVPVPAKGDNASLQCRTGWDCRAGFAGSAGAELASGAGLLLVKLVWDDCVLDQELEGDDLEGAFVGGLED